MPIGRGLKDAKHDRGPLRTQAGAGEQATALHDGHRLGPKTGFNAAPEALPDYELLEGPLRCHPTPRYQLLAKQLLDKFDNAFL